MKTTKYYLVQSWCIPLVLWIIHFGGVLFFSVIQKILPYDTWMIYTYIGLISPIIATVWGIWWNIKTLKWTNEQRIKKLSIGGALFWVVCIIIFSFYVLHVESSDTEYAPVQSEVIE